MSTEEGGENSLLLQARLVTLPYIKNAPSKFTCRVQTVFCNRRIINFKYLYMKKRYVGQNNENLGKKQKKPNGKNLEILEITK